MRKISLFQVARGISYPVILAGIIYGGVNADKTLNLINLIDSHARCLLQDIKAGALDSPDYKFMKQDEPGKIDENRIENKELSPYLNNIYWI